jgi:hypothetical protein
MYKGVHLLIAVLVVAAPFAVSEAAILYVNLEGGGTVTIHTGGTGGQCAVTPLGGDEGSDAECSDGSGNRASANTVTGCLETEGKGLCALGTVSISLFASNQLHCSGGVSYNMSTGNDEGSCVHTEGGSSMECDDGDSNSASADCENGCGDTHGSGCCCREGTAGCGAGKNCTGK